ncbi:MAG: exo-alpha-sialidase [Phycisphaerales bacterium]|nr:exo-alpha-sialidase [Phycisphaerales bacterium]
MISFIAVASMLTAALMLNSPPIPVFVGGNEGYPVYRIPSIVRLCPSTVPARLLAFAEGRDTLSDNGQNDLVMKSSLDAGVTWSALQVLLDVPTRSLNNPCAVVLRDGAHSGRVLLMFQSYPIGCSESCVEVGYDIGAHGDKICRTFTMYSDDDGATWSTPKEVTRGVKRATRVTSVATGPGVGIQLRRGEHRGRIVMPFNEGPAGKWRVYAAFSDDDGESWNIGEPAKDGGEENAAKGVANEVQMIEREDGAVVLNARQYYGSGRRKTALSTDGGANFGALVDIPELPDPSCMGGCIVLHDALDSLSSGAPFTTVAFTGCDSETRRANGALWISRDGGRTWPQKVSIEIKGFAYSVPVALAAHEVGVLYETAGYKQIVFTKVSVPDASVR